ncbi:MAG TPA: hypothetical protein VKP30_31755 [Polyangiaceae bacterium]|nr:hypothetical protein [Polyangiaceae bacterium]
MNEAHDTKAFMRLLQQLAYACALVVLALARAPIGQTQVAVHFSVERISSATMTEASACYSGRGRRSQATTLEQHDGQSRGNAAGDDDFAAVRPLDVGLEVSGQRYRLLPPIERRLDCTSHRPVALQAPRARAPPRARNRTHLTMV